MSLRSLLKEIFPDGSSLMGERPLLFGYGQGSSTGWVVFTVALSPRPASRSAIRLDRDSMASRGTALFSLSLTWLITILGSWPRPQRLLARLIRPWGWCYELKAEL